ncbi:MAG TPA: alkaline shock response membrane anchor protein AmaP [Candidatus Omnitrophota bacterium]|nr:alkaline shock response membrane anchor protein AmaP [Candidatus Omnitrophota bacterium]
MRVLTHIAMFFYLAIITFVAAVAVSFAVHRIKFEELTYFLNIAYQSRNICIAIIIVSVTAVLVGFLFSRIILGVQQKERTIAFENPSGRVTISLVALEDMIKRTVLRVSEVKEVRSSVRATKKGIDVTCRLVLKAESNIPDMTSRIQDLVKSRIQEILGLEENVIVRIHITKIMTQSEKDSSGSESDRKDFSDMSVPFKGYRK